MRHYAEDTSVPIARSRGEIDKLLRIWGAEGVQWSDDFAKDKITLRFIWVRPSGGKYVARFELKLPTRRSLQDHAIDARSGRVNENKVAKLLDARGKQEHRVLLLWLKAALNAVQLGLVDPMVLFLPFFEDKFGQTVAEVALPRLPELTAGRAERLLEAGA